VGLRKQMTDAIIELCDFFRRFFSKTNKAEDFEKLHTDIGSILFKFEEKFFTCVLHGDDSPDSSFSSKDKG